METLETQSTQKKKVSVKYSRVKRKILSHVVLVRIGAILAILVLLVGVSILTVNFWKKVNGKVYFDTAYNFLTAPIGQVASENRRTNILVMGKAGGEHDGPDLTDTIMLLSVSLTDTDVKIISIPRDLWIPDIRAKINSAYYWGNEKNVGGLNFAKAEASEVVGVPIHYAAVINFAGFKDVIDEIGGITVNVENSFTDYYYPIAGKENDTCGGKDPRYMCRYETLTFNKGVQQMDGTTALKFVRSRHAEGVEGTDIAREARQQKVIEALKNKLSDKNTYTNLGKDRQILKVILNSIETDVDYPTAGIIARKIYDGRNSITSYLIPEGLLVNPPVTAKYDMQSVFVPRSGNFDEINKWVKSTL